MFRARRVKSVRFWAAYGTSVISSEGCQSIDDEPTVDVDLGDVVTYTITLVNASAADALGVILTDARPAGIVFEAFVENEGGAVEDEGVVTWSGDLAAGETLTIVFTATVMDDDDLYGHEIANRVEYDSEDAGDGYAEATFTVKPVFKLYLPADLAVELVGKSGMTNLRVGGPPRALI